MTFAYKYAIGQVIKLFSKESKVRANAVYLNEEQMWDMVKYIIENRGVVQDENKDFLKFRVAKKTLADELSKIYSLKIGAHQVEKMVNWHAKICNLFGNKPIAPPPQESVEEDRLKIENAKLKSDINILQEQLHKYANTELSQRELLGIYKIKLTKIVGIATQDK